MEGRQKPFGVSQDEELEDLRTRAPSECVLEPSHADADDFRPACFGIPGFAQEVNEGVNPFVLNRVEAHRMNATPMAVARIARRLRHRPFGAHGAIPRLVRRHGGVILRRVLDPLCDCALNLGPRQSKTLAAHNISAVDAFDATGAEK